MTANRRLSLLSLTALTAVLAAPADARAQDALGAGDALDRNLGVGTGRRNVQAPQDDFRSRNLIVTGNVAGGRGFRGTVGYTAENDFRGVIGSDSTYQFRADSALSAINFLQYRDTFTSFELGQNLGLLEFQRDAYGVSAGNVADNPYRLSAQMTDTRLRLDRLNQASSLSEMRESLAEPAIIGIAYDDEGEPLAVNASSLRGVLVQPAKSAPQAIGLSTFDLVRLREDLMAQREVGSVGAPYRTDFTTFEQALGDEPAESSRPAGESGDDGRVDSRIDSRLDLRMEPGETDSRIDTRFVQESYEDILKRVADRYAKLQEQASAGSGEEGAPKTALEKLDEDYRRLRERLLGRPEQPKENEDPTAIPSGTSLDPQAEDEPGPTHSFDALMNRAQEDLERFADGDLPQDATVEDVLREGGVKLPGQELPGQPRRGAGDEERESGLPRTTLPDVDTMLRPEITRPFDPNAPQADPDEEAEPARPGAVETPVLPRVEEFGVLLSHGGRIDTLTAGDDTRFNELIGSAEERLRTGEYFWAERRFSRALRFKPGHPLATAGMGHAQLGAGIYLSSALTLRKLLASHPEMIDTTYGAGLFPTRVRLLQAIDTLRQRVGEGSRDAAAYGFLLAYIGHQLDDRVLIGEGVDVMKTAAPEDKLVPLLEEIWLADDEAAAPAPPDSK